MLKLHIGCGPHKKEGWVNIDISPDVKPDKVASWESLPFRNSTVDEIFSQHVLEHTADFGQALRETWRVLKKGGKAKIIVPYAGIVNAYHPHHRWYFSYTSFDPFRKGHGQNYYYNATFGKVSVSLVFSGPFKWMESIANRFPQHYENSGLAWMFPAKELHVEFVK